MYMTLEEAKRQYAAEQRHKEEVANAFLKGAEVCYNRMVEWLEKNADGYIWYNEMTGESGMVYSFLPDLKKAIWGGQKDGD